MCILFLDRLQISNEETDESTRRRWPKKLPKEDRNKTYKQYTARELRMAIEAVLSNRLSRKEASELYRVPRKTLTAKLQTSIANKEGMVKSILLITGFQLNQINIYFMLRFAL